jgi:dipicolinate synthase subunit A
MCRQLSAMGKVYTYGIFCPDSENITALGNLWEMTEKADVLVLPIVSGDSEDIRCGDGSFVPCDEIAKHLSKHAVVVGGRLNTSQIELFSALGHDVVDYFKREEFVVKNCIPTAEGALQIALKEMGTTVFGSEVLITGYGRVAKACGRLFNAVGGNVTVAARSLSQLAEAENNGLGAFPLTELYGHIPRFDIIINTVPAMIFDRQTLGAVAKDSLIIDLASVPGGVDFTAAAELNKRTVHALSLPGKTAPITSGRIIADTVRNILIERGK